MTKKSSSCSLIARICSGLWELVSTIAPALLIALFVNVYIAEAAMIEAGPSMQPNLYVGNRVMMEKISYRFGPPKRGDVVIVDRPGDGTNLIKRVIALPGEVIEVKNGHALIDGEPIEEPWVQNFGGPGYNARQVPAGFIFILGDNRSVSMDSRAIGPVPIDEVMGRVILIYWPPGKIKLLP